MVQISTSKSTSKYSYITVCNYNDYQYNGDEGNQQTNHEATSKQPANNQQVTTDNNVNNILNDSNEEDLKEIQKKSFEEWWIYWKSLIWKHEGKKQKALEYYLKLKFTPEQITEATRKYIKSKKDSGQFHQAAEGFLNPQQKQVQYYLEEPPPPAAPQQQTRKAAEPAFSPGTIHVFKVELANMTVAAAKILWEQKPKSFREYPRLLQIYNNKLKEEHDPEIL